MSTRWVAIDVAIGDNPKVWRFAAALFPNASGKLADMALAASVGHINMLLGAMKIHAPDGDVGDVPDDLLELWAKWRGKRGAFAAAWRAAFAPDGHLNDWDEWNGRLVKQQEAERKRWHERKERGVQRGDSAGDSGTHSAGDSTGGTAESPCVPNLTIPTNQRATAKPAARAKRVRSERPAETWLTSASAAWESVFGPGSFDFGKASKYLSRLKNAGLTSEEIGRRLGRYAQARKGGFCSYADFAEHHAEWAEPDGPLVDADGVLTEAGERATRPDGVARSPYGPLAKGAA